MFSLLIIEFVTFYIVLTFFYSVLPYNIKQLFSQHKTVILISVHIYKSLNINKQK